MNNNKEDEAVIKLISHAYPNKPTNQELANIRNTRRRVFVENPQVTDYDSMYDQKPINKEPPKGYRQRSDLSVVLGFFAIVLLVFLGIAVVLGVLL